MDFTLNEEQQMLRETPRLIGATIDLSFLRESAGVASDAAATMAGPSESPLRLDALLFGETQNRVVITTHPLHAVKVVERAKRLGVPARQIGYVGSDELTIKTGVGESSWPVSALHEAWWNALARAMA